MQSWQTCAALRGKLRFASVGTENTVSRRLTGLGSPYRPFNGLWPQYLSVYVSNRALMSNSPSLWHIVGRYFVTLTVGIGMVDFRPVADIKRYAEIMAYQSIQS